MDRSRPIVLVLFGPPGCGKGTQGVRLEKHYGIPSISTGDILRRAVRDETELGRRARQYMEAGRLVPDEVMLDLIDERLSAPDTGGGFILDGFPRTIAQAEGLSHVLDRKGLPITRVINLEVPRERLIERLTSRRLCSKCGAPFNVISIPPPPEGACADPEIECSGEHIFQRDDDRPETVSRRLDVYEEQTAPLIGHYRDHDLLTDVVGDDRPERVFEHVVAEIG